MKTLGQFILFIMERLWLSIPIAYCIALITLGLEL